MTSNTDPDHYKRRTPEPIQVIQDWGLNFCLGNVVKYIARHDAKGGTEDLSKALRYLEFEIAKREAAACPTCSDRQTVGSGKDEINCPDCKPYTEIASCDFVARSMRPHRD